MSVLGANVRTVTPSIAVRPPAAAVGLVARLGTDPSNVAVAPDRADRLAPLDRTYHRYSPTRIVVLRAHPAARHSGYEREKALPGPVQKACGRVTSPSGSRSSRG